MPQETILITSEMILILILMVRQATRQSIQLMQLEITRAANNLDEARLEVQLCDRSLEQAEESMQLSRQQYEAGVEPLSDYLEAQALWQQAWQSQVDARFQLYLQSVAYLKACGRLVE